MENVDTSKGSRHMLQGKICDRLRSGKQTDADRKILMSQRLNFPDFVSDYTLHYEDESCTRTNWQQLLSVDRVQGVRSLQTFVHLQGFVPHDGSEQSSR